MRLVVTSRDASRGNMGAVLETLEIRPDALYSFLDRYIARLSAERGAPRPDEAVIHEACAQLKRLLRGMPTTPLFASIWAEEVAQGGAGAGARIHGVAELFDSYVERLLSPAGRNAVDVADLRLDLAAIAVWELAESRTPGWFWLAAPHRTARPIVPAAMRIAVKPCACGAPLRGCGA